MSDPMNNERHAELVRLIEQHGLVPMMEALITAARRSAQRRQAEAAGQRENENHGVDQTYHRLIGCATDEEHVACELLKLLAYYTRNAHGPHWT